MVVHDSVVVLDYGTSHSQTGHLIARGIRRAGVYSELLNEKEMKDRLDKGDPSIKGIVLPGGPDSVYEPGAPRPEWVFNYGRPVFGVCYGHQFLGFAKGGEVTAGRGEYGKVNLRVLKESRLLKGVPQNSVGWMSHGDSVTRVPEGFDVYASTENCPVAAFGNEQERLFGVQYHVELFQTEHGELVTRNFTEISGCKPTWTMGNYHGEIIDKIRGQVGGRKVISALSGGVDSSVSTALLAEAIDDKLIAVFVDHGGLREGEGEEVKEIFGKYSKVRLNYIDAKERFRNALRGVSDPEEKRDVVGAEFAKVFLDIASEEGTDCLGQGTIYPDIIESRGKIKGHHNRNRLIVEYFEKRGGLIEPLAELYKDEVRDMGLEVGLPFEIVHRQPGPGPMLYIRVYGEVTDDKLRLARATDLILRQEIDKLPFEERPWQYFTFVPDVKATGVKGDKRAYGDMVIVRAVTSRDGMSADAWDIGKEMRDRLQSRMTSEVPGVLRVLYDLTQKPPGTIEFI